MDHLEQIEHFHPINHFPPCAHAHTREQLYGSKVFYPFYLLWEITVQQEKRCFYRVKLKPRKTGLRDNGRDGRENQD